MAGPYTIFVCRVNAHPAPLEKYRGTGNDNNKKYYFQSLVGRGCVGTFFFLLGGLGARALSSRSFRCNRN